MRLHRHPVSALPMLFACTLLVSCVGMDDKREFNGSVQGLIGLSMLGDDDVQIDDRSELDPTLEGDTDVSTMPLLGGVGQMPILGDQFHLGIEGGAMFSWESDRTSVRSQGGATTVRIKTSIQMLDLFFGPYLSAKLFDSVRIYGGVGPAITIAWLDTERDEDDGTSEIDVDNRDNDTTLGVYGRAGVDFEVAKGQYAGFGVRYLDTEFKFDGHPTVDVEGTQAYFTYTIAF